MTWTGCDQTAWSLTSALQNERVVARVAQAMASRASVPELIEAIIQDLDPAVCAIVREELGALPAAAVEGILAAWQTAHAGNKPFVFASVAPERPIDLARRRRVRVVIDVDEEGVHAALSHIPSRHPSWSAGAS